MIRLFWVSLIILAFGVLGCNSNDSFDLSRYPGIDTLRTLMREIEVDRLRVLRQLAAVDLQDDLSKLKFDMMRTQILLHNDTLLEDFQETNREMMNICRDGYRAEIEGYDKEEEHALLPSTIDSMIQVELRKK